MIYTLTLNPAIDREYTVPHIIMGEVLRASETRIDHGGKGLNVSRMLASLGMASTAVGFVGGLSGTFLREGLESAGINTSFINVKGETRTNISIVDQGHRHHIKVNEAGPTVSEHEIESLITRITRLVKPGDYWILSGNLPPNTPKDIYSRIIQIVQGAGGLAVLDSSGESLRLGCEAGPYLVKPNASEASQIFGIPAGNLGKMATIMSDLHAMGVKLVVISAGKKGALLSDGQEQWLGRTPVIKEQNPIGAGDAMLAGIVWKLALGEKPLTAMRWGLACGAATASLPGTGMATIDLVKSLFPKTKLESAKSAFREN